MNPLKLLCIILGFIFFGLGAIGAFLPIIPTTPFLLLAAFFFAKGSRRFNAWFTSTKLYQDYASSFLKHRTMTLKVKLSICTLATIMLVISLILVDVIYARIAIGFIILFMYYYFIFRIKTVSPEEDSAIKASDKAEHEAALSESVSLKDTIRDVRNIHEEFFEEGFNKDTPVIEPAAVKAASSQDEDLL